MVGGWGLGSLHPTILGTRSTRQCLKLLQSYTKTVGTILIHTHTTLIPTMVHLSICTTEFVDIRSALARSSAISAPSRRVAAFYISSCMGPMHKSNSDPLTSWRGGGPAVDCYVPWAAPVILWPGQVGVPFWPIGRPRHCGGFLRILAWTWPRTPSCDMESIAW